MIAKCYLSRTHLRSTLPLCVCSMGATTSLDSCSVTGFAISGTNLFAGTRSGVLFFHGWWDELDSCQFWIGVLGICMGSSRRRNEALCCNCRHLSQILWRCLSLYQQRHQLDAC